MKDINADECTGTELISSILDQMVENETNRAALPIPTKSGTLYLRMELVPEEEMFGELDTELELTSTRTLQ